MKKTYRVKKKSEIDAIFKERKVKGDKYFAIYQASDLDSDNFRFALSIGKKFGNAVSRNLAKRRIRMIVSELARYLDKNKIFVIVIKPKAHELEYKEINERIKAILVNSQLMESIDEK